jgi:Family of unknown function (DUF6328)
VPDERARTTAGGSAPWPAADWASGEESADARHNRQLVELLNELRVALPGVQMLFGFLLAVPFAQRFADVSHGQRLVYFASFLAAAGASVCFIAPASFHRIVWKRGLKRRLLHMANALTIIGTLFLAVAIVGSVVFVSSVLFGSSVAVAVSAVVAGMLAVLWYVIPLFFRLTRHQVDPQRLA